MHNLLSIYQTKYCKTTFLALISLSYIILNRAVVEKQHYYVRNCNKPIVITEVQLNLQNHIHVCCCSFNKIFVKRIYCAPKQVWPKDKFWLKNKFWLFYLITWNSLMVWVWNLVCGRFMNFKKGRYIVTLLTFGCPSSRAATWGRAAPGPVQKCRPSPGHELNQSQAFQNGIIS